MNQPSDTQQGKITEPAKPGELTVRRFKSPREALGHAVALLRDVEL